MKTFKWIIPVFSILLCWSCQNKGQLLSDEQISINLLKSGEADTELLIGKWELVKFAYTADGKKISNVATVSGDSLSIPAEYLWYVSESTYTCSISGNLIELALSSTSIDVEPPHIKYDVMFALSCAYSFVIKGDELIIYFKRVEDEKLLSSCTVIENKNLIIFKKR